MAKTPMSVAMKMPVIVDAEFEVELRDVRVAVREMRKHPTERRYARDGCLAIRRAKLLLGEILFCHGDRCSAVFEFAELAEEAATLAAKTKDRTTIKSLARHATDINLAISKVAA